MGGDFGEIVDILLLSCLLGRTGVGGGAGNTRMIAKGQQKKHKKKLKSGIFSNFKCTRGWCRVHRKDSKRSNT